MGWPVEETPTMSIKLGDGFRAQSQGAVKGLEIGINDFALTPVMHLFELGGVDVVLGMEWLKTLGDMIVNWRQQTMSFWSDKKWVTLRGMDDGRADLVALQCILSKPQFGRSMKIWGMEQKSTMDGSNLSFKQKEELEELLQKYGFPRAIRVTSQKEQRARHQFGGESWSSQCPTLQVSASPQK
jgi:hypothetical protein